MSTLRVLIVEDSEDDVMLVVRALKNAGFSLEYARVETTQAMEQALTAEPWDLIISDHVMPEFNSFQALEVLKRSGLDIPFILVSGSIGEETAVEAMKAGVHDFIMKDKLARLVPAVRRELKEVANRREKKAAYEALVAAKQVAEAANEAKDTFLANMSHEIRTPLSGIMGLMQLMQSTPLAPDQKRFVDMALTSADRLTTLLSDILDISSLESGLLEIRQDKVNLRDLGDSVMDLFSATAEKKNIALDSTYDPSIPGILFGDEVRVRQILFNLVGNALKFTEKGRVVVEMSPVGLNRENHLRLLISVSDTGIGMPEDQLDEMFKPFVQSDSTTTRKYQGAGLGLTIVKRLVELMNGTIAVESAPGEGTTFHVLLPFVIPGVVNGKSVRVSKSRRNIGDVNILYAEDDPINQVPIQLLLEKAGYRVALAEDGRRVLDMLVHEDYDCILMDVQMPIMDGIEATKAIRSSRALGKKKNIPIIALSAKAMPGDRERFLQAGMNDYLAKPVRFQDLDRIVRQYCGVGGDPA
ncbi:Signal transduction histidine kinase [Desulfonatronum thiosulfatophilum]|uniref:histidine kinase n=1 Tax=Desulfonatronum thiosulfatophilum TaxID=617002 RepID=A0A1G6BPH8_9BACT|nr:response regulator [Desulfonatronum thiosulfatophilum]SDB22497.1 Signal transduction histidine kinase [Desulfonatronum thiosulfatophilum]